MDGGHISESRFSQTTIEDPAYGESIGRSLACLQYVCEPGIILTTTIMCALPPAVDLSINLTAELMRKPEDFWVPVSKELS